MKSYKVSGSALQTFEWDMVVQAKDELEAKIVANQAVYTLHQEVHRVRADTVVEMTEGQVDVPGVGIRGTGLVEENPQDMIDYAAHLDGVDDWSEGGPRAEG